MLIKNIENVIFCYIEETLLDIVRKFAYRNISFDMQPIVDYLLNSALLSICGTFEEKIETCKYYIAGLDINYRYSFLKNFGTTIYDAKKLLQILKNINQFDTSDNSASSKDTSLTDIYLEYRKEVEESIHLYFNQSEFIEYKKTEFSIYDRIWLCLDELVEKDPYKDLLSKKAQKYDFKKDGFKTALYVIYDSLFLYRHTLAHNLSSLYYINRDFFDFDSELYFEKNYFVRISLLMCLDRYLMKKMKAIIYK